MFSLSRALIPHTTPYTLTKIIRLGVRAHGTTSESNLDVDHAHFLAEASAKTKWTQDGPSDRERIAPAGDDLDGVAEGRGKLSPTSSHLFKLILPLGGLQNTSVRVRQSGTPPASNAPPTVFLLHPSQPLSHVSRLIRAALGPTAPVVSFRSSPRHGRPSEWSASTDLGDFIRDAARAAEFSICLSFPRRKRRRLSQALGSQGEKAGTSAAALDLPHTQGASGAGAAPASGSKGNAEAIIAVAVPTFAARTRFLQQRLARVGMRLNTLAGLKEKCDAEARRGARRMALGGFGMLVVYWGTVARLTFWDYGWDVMEPITYLSGLSTVVVGYLWFLYQGREVSYSAVLARSISARRAALYKERGFDIDHWADLVEEKKALRAEIARIARDYEDDEDDAKQSARGKGQGSAESEGEGEGEGERRVESMQHGEERSNDIHGSVYEQADLVDEEARKRKIRAT